MKTQTIHYRLDSGLTLFDSVKKSIFLPEPELFLHSKNNTLFTCGLSFKINSELYERIDAQALFNLKPEVRGSLLEPNFLPGVNIAIAANLSPALLPRIATYLDNLEEVGTYLLTLCQEQPDDILLFSESWFALYVEQIQGTTKKGYRTFWDYLKLSTKTVTDIEEGKITDALFGFLQERTNIAFSENNKGEVDNEEINEVMNEVFSEAIKDLFKELFNDDEVEEIDETKSGEFFAIVIKFFKEEEWEVYQVDGELTLGMTLQGENGSWTGYAQVNEQEQFIFYSVLPFEAPEHKKIAMAEFLNRVNFNLIIGNFAMNFADGQIVYKTSMDIEGTPLTSALIKHLVYANVLTTDKYLSGIEKVICSDILPAEAIAQIEN